MNFLMQISSMNNVCDKIEYPSGTAGDEQGGGAAEKPGGTGNLAIGNQLMKCKFRNRRKHCFKMKLLLWRNKHAYSAKFQISDYQNKPLEKGRVMLF